MRVFGILTGTILVLVGLYVVVGERLAGTSADATVNARIVSVRAPIDGAVTLLARDLGTRVEAQQNVAEIFDTRHDTARLLELERGQSQLETDLKRVKAQLTALSQASDQLQQQASRYQTGRVQQIESRIGEAKAAFESAQARLREAESALKRTSDLSTRGLQTAITLDRAKAGYDVAAQEVQSAQQRLDYLSTERDSARQGVFLGDSYNDTPFSSQRGRELDLRTAEAAAEQQQIEQRLAATTQQISAERVRLNKLTNAVLTAGQKAQVWDVLTSSGEYVRRGEEILRLADCSGLLVTASVSEGVFNNLHPGAQARLRLFGDDRVFNATVIRLGGSGAAALYTNLAVGASPEHLKRFNVTLSAPDLANHPDLQCAIGRTGRIVFTSGPLAAVKQVATRLGF